MNLGDFSAFPWAQMFTAIFCGALIGLERQLRGKTAGIRTSSLICMGTQVFVFLGASFADDTTAVARVVGQVVTGIGFLGAGVIMAKGGSVTGVTSAAVIWVLSAIGAASGLGMLAFALTITLFTLAVLIGVEFLESTFQRLQRGVHALYRGGKKHDR